MADSADIVRALQPAASPLHYPVLTPICGFDAALAAGAREVAVFAAASESVFPAQYPVQHRRQPGALCPGAGRRPSARRGGARLCLLRARLPLREATSPRRWPTSACACWRWAARNLLGDTIGVGTPARVRRLLDALLPEIPASEAGRAFHDTYGMAIANIVAAMECGLATFDSSVVVWAAARMRAVRQRGHRGCGVHC